VHAVLCFTRALVAVGQEIRASKIVQVPRLARLIERVSRRLSETDVEAAVRMVTQAPAPSRRRFRLTPRRQAAPNERPLTLVGPSIPTTESRLVARRS
jgi:hypothetical protein